MRRRDFVILLAGAMGGRPSAARAQQKAMPVIGFLNGGAPEPAALNVAAFRQGLSETGYVEGQNVAIDYRWAEGRFDRLPAMAADLVGRKIDVIFAAGDPPVVAAKNATSTIPDRLPHLRRPRRGRPGRHFRSARRQCHGLQLHGSRADAQAVRAAIRADSPDEGICSAREPELPNYRSDGPRDAGRLLAQRECGFIS
jgi:hypothetical protein